MRTIEQLLIGSSQAHPGRISIRGLGRDPLTYAGLESSTAEASRQLAGRGLQRSDRIGIVLPNGPEVAVALTAVMRAFVAAPLNPTYRYAEFRYYLEDLAVAAVIVPADESLPEAREAARDLQIPIIGLRPNAKRAAGSFRLEGGVDDQDVQFEPLSASSEALVLHTSGTTSRPKMVPLSQGNLLASARSVAATVRLAPSDVGLNIMPLFHIHGIVAGLLASLAAGASVVCTPGFSAKDVLDWLREEDPTWFTAVPTMHQALLAAARARGLAPANPALRFIRSSSSSLPPSVLEELQRTFGVAVVEAYGMTEAAHQVASNPLPPGRQKPGSVGPAAGPEVSIVDEHGAHVGPGEIGEVVIRGPSVTRGYLGDDDPSTAVLRGGWFRTGDQGYLDDDGYLSLTGRLREMINRGGETIAPREIDEALLKHPAVAQATAFGVPDERLGEEVAAAVVLEDGSSVSARELVGWLEGFLSFAKLPKAIVFVAEIPKGPTGKLQRVGLGERLGLTGIELGIVAPTKAPPLPPDALQETMDRLRYLWQISLGVAVPDIDVSFLDAGGDSVSAAALVFQARREFEFDIPLMEFYSAGTIREQARLIARLVEESERSESGGP